MRGDRRPALLTATRAAAGLAGAAVVLVPLHPLVGSVSPPDVSVAWALLAAWVVLAPRRTRASILVGAAGVLWVLLVLVPTDGSVAATALARLALLPTALLAIAVMEVGGSRAVGLVRGCEAAAALTAVVAGTGHYRFALLVIGLVVAAVGAAGRQLLARGDGRRRAAVLLQAGVGTGLTIAGVLVALPVGWERSVTDLHAAVMVLAAAGLSAVNSPSGAEDTEGLELDTPGGLGAALGRALDRPPVSIALPKGDGSWLDAGGHKVEPLPDQEPWLGRGGELLARMSDPGDLDHQQRRSLDRMLSAAVQGARLRADLRERAAALDASRGRLLTAAADERARLATLIERGPIARLDRIAGLTSLVVDDPVLATRRQAARTALGSVLRGLDPTAAGLEPALRSLAADTGAVVRHDAQFPAPGRLDPARARALWFVCAEALANAVKHAPGAPVEITVRTSAYAVQVRVRDQGPGGADPSGSGLTGLSERAASVGGWLRMSSDRSGTELVIGVPTTGAQVPERPLPTTARTLMQVTAPAGTAAP